MITSKNNTIFENEILKQLFQLLLEKICPEPEPTKAPIFDNQVDKIMFEMGYDVKPILKRQNYE